MERKSKCPSWGCIPNMKLYLGHLCRQLLGYLRSWCSGEVACPPSLPASSPHLPPHGVPHHYCHVTSPHSRTVCVTLWGINFMVWDTWGFADVVTRSLQPAQGIIPCSNIFLERSCVSRLIRNTRIPGTFKTEGFGDSWVCFTSFKVFILLFKVCIRNSCWVFFLWIVFSNKF